MYVIEIPMFVKISKIFKMTVDEDKILNEIGISMEIQKLISLAHKCLHK